MSRRRKLKLLTDPGEAIKLAESGSMPAEWHVFEKRTIDAVNGALAAGRPLLVRGDPGVGKSQLARAAAQQLGRAFISYVVDSRTESRDLLYSFDAVQRLADAQICGHLYRDDIPRARQELDETKYLRPGPFWWAFDWKNASERVQHLPNLRRETPKNWTQTDGCTVLIDEIDKGERDVPNGLLEVLGAREFTPHGTAERIKMTGTPPLVVITTNAERILPDAFLRRCLVLSLTLPSDRDELVAALVERGAAHFSEAHNTVLQAAAELVADERVATTETPRPGQAEFLDLVRATLEIGKDAAEQISALDVIKPFLLQKRSGLD